MLQKVGPVFILQKSIVALGTSVSILALLISGHLAAEGMQTWLSAAFGVGEEELWFLHQMWTCFVAAVAIPAVFYWKNDEMRQKVMAMYRAFALGGGAAPQ